MAFPDDLALLVNKGTVGNSFEAPFLKIVLVSPVVLDISPFLVVDSTSDCVGILIEGDSDDADA